MNTPYEAVPENADNIVYVRPVDVRDLPEDMRAARLRVGRSGAQVAQKHRQDSEGTEISFHHDSFRFEFVDGERDSCALSKEEFVARGSCFIQSASLGFVSQASKRVFWCREPSFFGPHDAFRVGEVLLLPGVFVQVCFAPE